MRGLTITGGYELAGGAVVLWEYIPLAIDNCVLEGNTAGDFGGAVANLGGELSVTDSVFRDNEALEGGALGVGVSGTLAMAGCLFAGNAGETGGAVRLDGAGQAHVFGCTFADNRATGGAGLSVIDSTYDLLLLETCLIADNAGGEGLFWDANGQLDLVACDLYGNAGGDWVGPIAGQLGLAGNFAADPLFCRESNPDQVYSLGDGSPCSAGYDPVRGQVGACPVGCAMSGIDATSRLVRLHPCVPNPFNPRTAIAFELAEPARVRLTVHDLGGRLVRTLADGRLLSAGPHAADWGGVDGAGRPVAAGVYICRLEAGGVVDRTRMVLVR